MMRGIHPLQAMYRMGNLKCVADRSRFDHQLGLCLASDVVDGLKFFRLDKYPEESNSWAVDFVLVGLPKGVIAHVHQFAAHDFASSGIPYNLRVDAHPVFFYIFPDRDDVYCWFNNKYISHEETECIVDHVLGFDGSIDLPAHANLANSLFAPGELFEKLNGVGEWEKW